MFDSKKNILWVILLIVVVLAVLAIFLASKSQYIKTPELYKTNLSEITEQNNQEDIVIDPAITQEGEEERRQEIREEQIQLEQQIQTDLQSAQAEVPITTPEQQTQAIQDAQEYPDQVEPAVDEPIAEEDPVVDEE